MKVNRVTLDYERYGLPTKECKRNEVIQIRCFFGRFIHGGEYKIKNIKHIKPNLYAIESNQFKWYNYCFRPKWYQYPKLGLYYIFNKNVFGVIPSFVKHLIK